MREMPRLNTILWQPVLVTYIYACMAAQFTWSLCYIIFITYEILLWVYNIRKIVLRTVNRWGKRFSHPQLDGSTNWLEWRGVAECKRHRVDRCSKRWELCPTVYFTGLIWWWWRWYYSGWYYAYAIFNRISHTRNKISNISLIAIYEKISYLFEFPFSNNPSTKLRIERLSS